MPDQPTPRGIDPRGPRFAASVTTALLAVAVLLSLTGVSTAPAGVAGQGWAISSLTPLQRALDPGALLLLVVAVLFLWAVVSPRTAPWGVFYRRLIQPHVAPPSELEDPRPPRFAQGVGLFVVTIGLVLHVIGVPWALPIAAAAALVAAFLNAVFGLCLGCQLYLLLQRAGLIGRQRPAAA